MIEKIEKHWESVFSDPNLTISEKIEQARKGIENANFTIRACMIDSVFIRKSQQLEQINDSIDELSFILDRLTQLYK
jgi:hypothetical protein